MAALSLPPMQMVDILRMKKTSHEIGTVGIASKGVQLQTIGALGPGRNPIFEVY